MQDFEYYNFSPPKGWRISYGCGCLKFSWSYFCYDTASSGLHLWLELRVLEFMRSLHPRHGDLDFHVNVFPLPDVVGSCQTPKWTVGWWNYLYYNTSISVALLKRRGLHFPYPWYGPSLSAFVALPFSCLFFFDLQAVDDSHKKRLWYQTPVLIVLAS